ncbi:MAG TPA: hypothetical protein VJZ91_13820 [Blastocatellia bacterium]|nr:hypothetical protein [Blastocatellia bacterium]
MANEISLEEPLSHPSKPRSGLEELKKWRFTPEGRDERIARSLAALNRPASIRLSPDQWKFVAEDADIEDQF